MMRRAIVLTISDSASSGARTDLSGPKVIQRLRELGWTVDGDLLPDDRERIAARLAELADEGKFAAIFTTGGTGVAPRDVTPEATRDVIEKEIPGISEWMRMQGRQFTHRSLLSRGVSGCRGRTVIINLPGAPKAAVESLETIVDLVGHVVDLLEGNTEHEEQRETAPSGRTSEG
jgi:molybdenum cofactor synthesis domain-containing protein